MCALCGVLAGRDHWTDSSAQTEVFQRDKKHTRQRERQHRLRLTNQILEPYKLRLSDWSARGFILHGATGKQVLVEDLNAVWQAAENLLGRPCDPLDQSYLTKLPKLDPKQP